jgi:hypothetical protein
MDTITDWIVAISGIFSVLISFGILLVAYYQIRQVKIQLKKLSENQKNNNLMTVLELESEMNKRKENYDKANFEFREKNVEFEKENVEWNSDLIDIYNEKIGVAKENYFNSLDRLSYCILHNYLSDKDWRTEYRDTIFDAVDNNENCFGVSSRYRNIIKIYDKWKAT